MSATSVREELKQRRASLSAEEIQRRSLAVQQRVISLGDFIRAGTLALYSAFRGEVETGRLMQEGFSRGKRVVFPRVSEERLDFVAVDSSTVFHPGPWGVAEPAAGRTVAVTEIDLMVLPGLAFDRRCFRLGWGKGYYDRVLDNYQGVCLGLAYDFQILPELPIREGERPLDFVVSEETVLRRSS